MKSKWRGKSHAIFYAADPLEKVFFYSLNARAQRPLEDCEADFERSDCMRLLAATSFNEPDMYL